MQNVTLLILYRDPIIQIQETIQKNIFIKDKLMFLI